MFLAQPLKQFTAVVLSQARRQTVWCTELNHSRTVGQLYINRKQCSVVCNYKCN